MISASMNSVQQLGIGHILYVQIVTLWRGVEINPCGGEDQKQIKETMCCRGLHTGVQAQNRGGKGLETSCVEVKLSIYGRNARDSWGKFGNCIVTLERTLIIKMESDLFYCGKYFFIPAKREGNVFLFAFFLIFI